MWEVYTYGMSPYPGAEDSQLFELLNTGYRMNCPHGGPAQVYDLMRQCWEWEPGVRPTFREISAMFTSMSDITEGKYRRCL